MLPLFLGFFHFKMAFVSKLFCLTCAVGSPRTYSVQEALSSLRLSSDGIATLQVHDVVPVFLA